MAAAGILISKQPMALAGFCVGVPTFFGFFAFSLYFVWSQILVAAASITELSVET
jgi:hypothetical protein